VKDDYASFAPYLDKLMEMRRRFAQRKDAGKPAYDVLLDLYEKGLSTEVLDPFFDLLRAELTPVIQAVSEKPAPRTDFLRRHYPAEKQRVFSDRVMELMGLPRDRCAIAETEHPFTDSNNKWDVRITTHYHEDDPFASMYSVIHEGGHALYELDVRDDLQFTCLAGGATMGIHESQSRFYENIIARSRAFCTPLLKILKDVFPEQTAALTEEELYSAINLSEPSLIRTDADELTYPLHVMIRYEIEKGIMAGELQVKDLPGAWNEQYRKYLGVEVPDDRRGVLQDSHWAGGNIGYFPSYALGSAYGAQYLRKMKETVDVDGCLRRGDLGPINAWNREHIWRHGHLYRPAELFANATGESFDPTVYTDYLEQKFTALYDL
jgi:carboxypeptidase Taq